MTTMNPWRACSHHEAPARHMPAQFPRLHPDWLPPAGWHDPADDDPDDPDDRDDPPIAPNSGAGLPVTFNATAGSPTTPLASTGLPREFDSRVPYLATPAANAGLPADLQSANASPTTPPALAAIASKLLAASCGMPASDPAPHDVSASCTGLPRECNSRDASFPSPQRVAAPGSAGSPPPYLM